MKNHKNKIIKYTTTICFVVFSIPAFCFEATVQKVYDDLIISIGNNYGGRPKLEFSNQKKYVAYFSPNNTITFEKSAFDVCKSLGSDSLNAIAYILAHELGHHYRDHFWIKEAGSAYASLEIGKSLRDAKSSFDQVREADADEFACYHTIIAGYNLSDPGPLLKALYKEYELPEEMPNYPSLSDRISIAKRVKKEASEMAEVFRCANFALLAKENDLAMRMYG
ncbi:MAG: M48 family metalloprotease, partial [Bacteroidota bacterium]